MVEAARSRNREWRPLFAVLLFGLTGAAPVETTVSGKIQAIDPTAGTVRIRPMNPSVDRILRLNRETIVKGASGAGKLSALAAGQIVLATIEPESQVVKTLTVVLASAKSGSHSRAGNTSQTTRQVQGSQSVDRSSAESTRRADANRAYVLATTVSKTVHAVLTYELTFPGATAREWVVLAPRAPELPGQMHVRSVLSPGGGPTWDMGPGHRPLLASRLMVAPYDRSQSKRISARAEYQATLLARHLERRRGTAGEVVEPTPLGAEERRRALAQGGTYELEAPEFRRWLSSEALSLGPEESEIDFARRVYLAIRRGYTYEFREGMDRRLSHVCASRRSDCGGLAILFAGALRTQGIPARVLVGRWARSAEPGERLGGVAYYQWHVKAEFFAEGVGWIPADPAWSLVYDHSADGLRSFGHDRGDFLTLHVDPDLVLDSIHFGPQPTPFLNGGLGVWVEGSGSLAYPRIKQDWQVRDVGMLTRAGPESGPTR